MPTTHVLIVDDDPMVIVWLESTLKKAGYTSVTTVSTGEEAIQKAAETAPDIVLMDIYLGGEIDGIEAAGRIRAQADIPIIYLTANTDAEVAYRAKFSEPFGYLCKPMQAGELTLSIEMSLYRHRIETELKTANLNLQQEIEARKKTEQELQRYRGHLEELVEERTLELATTNAQLQQEIAARQNLETVLHESEELHRLTLNNISDTVFITDDTGAFTFICGNIQVIFGYTVEEVWQGGTVERLLGAWMVDEETLAAEGEVTDIEQTITDKFGRPHTILVNVKRVPIQGGTRLYTCRDMTDRKRAEEALKTSEARYRTLFEDAAISLWEQDLSGVKASIDDLKDTGVSDVRAYFQQHPEAVLACAARVKTLEVNRATLALYGAASQEELFEWFETIFCESSVEGLLEGFCAVAEGRGWSQHEALNRRLSGETLNLIVRWVVVPGYEATYERVLVSVFDITNLKQTEEELRTARETALEAQREAEAANRAKSEFLANMSHELRTPLNSMLGYTQILKRDPALSEPYQNRLDHIERSGQHLLLLINDLLDLARIETGRIELMAETVHLPAFLMHIADMIEFRAREKEVTLVREFAPDLPQAVSTDEVRLRQILLNLLGNALKFTEPGGTVTFRVRSTRFSGLRVSEHAKSAEALTTNVLFEIADTGAGIPEEWLQKIFEPFEHVTQIRGRVDGVGLGLSISQRLAQMMGSRIQVRSTVGQGSLFWFEVTLSEVEMALISPKTSARPIVGFNGSFRKILLVDDDAENLDVLYEMLSPLGFEVAMAVDGAEAVSTARTWQPDLILMDLKMPQLDGWEATRRIRRLPELAPVKIIAISASAHDVTQQKALDAGCDAFFSKPFNLEQLLETIGELLDLEWRFESDSSEPAAAMSQEWVRPPADDLQTLQTYVENGLVLEIRAWADRLERLDARYAPFSRHIRQLNQEFAFEEMAALLEQFRSTKAEL